MGAREGSVVKTNLLNRNPLCVIDVGASGGVDPRWARFTQDFKAILFEPDPREYMRLARSASDKMIVMNTALSDRPGDVEFHLCRKQEVSSVFPPNFEFLGKFPEAERFEVLNKIEVPTNTLDDELVAKGIRDVDFIKVDVQGYELSVLRGGVRILPCVLGLEIEVEFAPMYAGQPLFPEVDQFVRQCGFELYDLKRYFWKRGTTGPHDARKGQLICGDALYFRSPEQVMSMPDVDADKCVRAICTYLVYGYHDLARAMLNLAMERRLFNGAYSQELLNLLLYSRSGRGLPNFRGKGRIESFFLAIARVFAHRNPYSGTDKVIGNC